MILDSELAGAEHVEYVAPRMSFSYTPQVPADADRRRGAPIFLGGRKRLSRPTDQFQGHRQEAASAAFLTKANGDHGYRAGRRRSWLRRRPASRRKAAKRAAPAEKKKNYKDQQEYTLYDSVTKETDPNKKLATLNTWKEKYPDSDFKAERLALFLSTYQQLGTAGQDGRDGQRNSGHRSQGYSGIYWITFLTPTIGNTSADALDTAEKAANGLLAAEKPANVKDEDWTKAKAQTDAAAYTTLGWVAMQKKNNDAAEQNFKKALAISPNAPQVSYWLGTTILAEKKPEKQSEALFDFARAAAYDGTGALSPAGRKQIDDYLTKVYKTYHGDTSGLDDLKAAAKASALPPADFKIKTADEIAAEKDAEFKKNNPGLALWKGIKGQPFGGRWSTIL